MISFRSIPIDKQSQYYFPEYLNGFMGENQTNQSNIHEKTLTHRRIKIEPAGYQLVRDLFDNDLEEKRNEVFGTLRHRKRERDCFSRRASSFAMTGGPSSIAGVLGARGRRSRPRAPKTPAIDDEPLRHCEGGGTTTEAIPFSFLVSGA